MKKTRLSEWLIGAWGYVFLSSIFIFIIGLSSPAPFLVGVLSNHSQWCQCQRVIDGDTIDVNCSGQVHRLRLMYIDTPEMRQPLWGQQAQKTLQSLLNQSKQQVFVEFHGKDIYQRDLAIVYEKEESSALNLQLVELGMARVYNRFHPPEIYTTAMKKAKKSHLGIWLTKGLHQDPSRFRRLAN